MEQLQLYAKNNQTKKDIRRRQDTEAHTTRLVMNNERKHGERRGKARDAANVDVVEL